MREDQWSESTVHTLLHVFLIITFEGTKNYTALQKAAAARVRLKGADDKRAVDIC